MQMAQLGDRVPVDIVYAARNIACLDVSDNDTHLDGAHGGGQRLPPVAEQQQDVG
jgi:hypothetical protein